jgi:hypothetical protein
MCYYDNDMEEGYKVTALLDKESFDKLNKRAKTNDRSISAELRVIIKEVKN